MQISATTNSSYRLQLHRTPQLLLSLLRRGPHPPVHASSPPSHPVRIHQGVRMPRNRCASVSGRLRHGTAIPIGADNPTSAAISSMGQHGSGDMPGAGPGCHLVSSGSQASATAQAAKHTAHRPLSLPPHSPRSSWSDSSPGVTDAQSTARLLQPRHFRAGADHTDCCRQLPSTPSDSHSDLGCQHCGI